MTEISVNCKKSNKIIPGVTLINVYGVKFLPFAQSRYHLVTKIMQETKLARQGPELSGCTVSFGKYYLRALIFSPPLLLAQAGSLNPNLRPVARNSRLALLNKDDSKEKATTSREEGEKPPRDRRGETRDYQALVDVSRN